MELLASVFGKVRELVKARIEAHMKKKMMESLKGLVSKVVGVVCLCFVVSMGLSVLCRFYALEA